MMYGSDLSIGELYDAYTEINESFDGAKTSLDELQTEITDGLSQFTTALDDIRDELEQCSHMIRRLNRRMSPILSYMMEQEDDETPFPPKRSKSGKKTYISFEEMLSN